MFKRALDVRLAVVAALLASAALFATPAHAQFGIAGFDGEALDQGGAAKTQAGSHPHKASTTISFNHRPGPLDLPVPYEQARNLRVELPPGLIGNPTVATRCAEPELTAEQGGVEGGACPSDSQVGRAVVDAAGVLWTAPVFNMIPEPGVVATFAFKVSGVKVHLNAELRSDGDYGVTIDSRDIPQALPVVSTTVTFWGVPADPVHDGERGGSPRPPLTQQAFVTNPTACTPTGLGVETKLWSRSWNGSVDEASFFSHHPAPNEDQQVGTTGCDRVPFEPSFETAIDTGAPDTPSGMTVDLAFPQDGLTDPDGIATSALKKAKVTLPERMTINPSSADGLAACSDQQLGLKTKNPLRCPAASKIGTVDATTPLLHEQLEGGVYLRSQASSDPESGEMFRVALHIANAERGIDVRLPGSVRADASTGRIEATFDNNPQLPVSAIRVRLKGGPRAPLATPAACGPNTVNAQLTSWSGQPIDSQSTFQVDCVLGLGGFGPYFSAGTVSPVAGASSPFALKIHKPDGQSDIDGIELSMPEGLLANLRDSVGEQIGTARVAAGPGPQPFWLSGPVVLEGPYGDAPFSLRVTVPAVAGPFNLGDVVVRQRIYVDPDDAHVRVVSDPLPTIVKGVPVRLQRLAVDIDRPGFMINPTSCGQKRIGATLRAATGQSAAVGSRFQVGDCAALPFKPRLSLALTGRKQIRTGKHPGVKATVVQSGIGEAGIKKAVVTLPKSLALDPDNAQALCEYEDGIEDDLENHCPKGSIVGRAKAATPLLDDPLAGNVYFVKNVERNPRTGALIRKLPMIIVALRGQIAINLRGVSSAPDGQLVNTFAAVPDAPIKRFNLNIAGGSRGILAVTRTREAKINLCAKPKSHVAEVETDGQNGKRADYTTRVKTPCGAKAARAGRSKQAKRRKG